MCVCVCKMQWKKWRTGTLFSKQWRGDSSPTTVWFSSYQTFPGLSFSLHLQPLSGRPSYLQTLPGHITQSSSSSVEATLLKICWFSSGADNTVIYILRGATKELVMQTQATDLTNLLEAELMSVFCAKT